MNQKNDSSDIESVLDWAVHEGSRQYGSATFGSTASADTGLAASNAGGAAARLHRRVGRARTRRAVGQGTVGALAIAAIAVGGMFLDNRNDSPDIAGPNPSPSASAATVSLDPASLLSAATDRGRFDAPRSDAQEALRCGFEPGDNPRLDPDPGDGSDSIHMIDCDSIWVADGQILDPLTLSASVNSAGDGIVVDWEVRNVTEQPLMVDRASVVPMIEADPGSEGTQSTQSGTADFPSAYGLSQYGQSLWGSDSTRDSVTNRISDVVTLAPGEQVSGQTEIIASGSLVSGDMIQRILQQDENVVLTATVRVAPFASDNEDLLLVFGQPYAAVPIPRYSATSQSAAVDTLTAAELFATARPREASEPTRNLAERALICDWQGDESPRSSPELNEFDDAVVMSDCDAVWVGDDSFIGEASSIGIDVNDQGTTATVWWELFNSADKPIVVDRASVSVQLEDGTAGFAPMLDGTVPEVSGLTVYADSLWVNDTQRVVAHGPEVDLVTIEPKSSITGSATFDLPSDRDGSLLDRFIHDDIQVMPTATIRVAPFASDATDLLLQIGGDTSTNAGIHSTSVVPQGG